MITFKVNSEKHQFPTVWDEVTYSQYIRLLTAPNSLPHYIHIFTGIPLETLQKAELKNLERISMALSFLSIPPKVEPKPTKMVGKYFLPKDVTLHSLGQFEDLKALMYRITPEMGKKIREEMPLNSDENILLANLYLEACSIYVQKIKDGTYDSVKVPEVMEELKAYSCIEICQTGGFFLAKPMNLLTSTTSRFQNIKARLKKSIQDLPGYKESLDLLQRSLESRGK